MAYLIIKQFALPSMKKMMRTKMFSSFSEILPKLQMVINQSIFIQFKRNQNSTDLCVLEVSEYVWYMCTAF